MGLMIPIPQPALALNAHDAPGWPYAMEVSQKVPSDWSASDIVAEIVTVAKGYSTGLEAVVVNCHAGPAVLKLGTGITRAHTGLFSQLCPTDSAGNYRILVHDIYLVACWIAKTEDGEKDADGRNMADGNLFCCAIAKNANAYVYAPTEYQKPSGDEPPHGHIDKFEGDVYVYFPDGSNRVWNGEKLARRAIRRGKR